MPIGPHTSACYPDHELGSSACFQGRMAERLSKAEKRVVEGRMSDWQLRQFFREDPRTSVSIQAFLSSKILQKPSLHNTWHKCTPESRRLEVICMRTYLSQEFKNLVADRDLVTKYKNPPAQGLMFKSRRGDVTKDVLY